MSEELKNFTGNFYPNQYEQDAKLDINHNYLVEQFHDHDEILKKIKEVVIKGDFTLGSTVDEVERDYANLCGTKHAIGVGSGTDALFLSLKTLGIKEGDEVITTPFTFFATIGSIVTAGAKPVFVDCGLDLNINPELIEAAITKKTKAIMPVHWSGRPCDMDKINKIANNYGIPVVEDACHAIKATYKNRPAGSLGNFGCFSFHPLKNLNVWGDGGIITTDSDEHAKYLKLIRNHGLIGRNECAEFGYNSRLDTVQAVVVKHMLNKIEHITESRIANASYLDDGLQGIDQITLPLRDNELKEVFHLYMFRAENRDDLQEFLITNNVDAKVHYPIPMHLQIAARKYGYKEGDFPVCERAGKSVISLPVHEFVTKPQLDKVIELIQNFYSK
jgi:dTDP-3-amino-2,3,6-trideoxy-4-keto-D-glucose/dTDP-3-amino-3,4,6-trideoxy-alpha-D-glucose/dTDP-2,6-dideoxy-D-kanosamine transaminase